MARIMELMGKKPALWMLSSTVVIPNPMSPSGAGLAVFSIVISGSSRWKIFRESHHSEAGHIVRSLGTEVDLFASQDRFATPSRGRAEPADHVEAATARTRLSFTIDQTTMPTRMAARIAEDPMVPKLRPP